MALWKAEEALKATAGKLINDISWKASKASIDSRKIEHGDLFIAIRGENNDGHNYLQEVYNKGASAAVVDNVPDNYGSLALPLLLVNNTTSALNDLGIYNRKRILPKTIGVTGSAGKTSTKELLRIAFASQGPTYANYGNYNNQYGVALSLSNMTLGTEFGIFEMGMNHAGELTELSAKVQPDIAIITNVEPAHLEFFGTVEKIAEAKAEIFTSVTTDGFAILNKDNNCFQQLYDLAKSNGIYNIISFGKSAHADCQLLKYSEDETGSFITAEIFGRQLSYRLSSYGMHHARNSLAVLAAIYAAKGDVTKAAEALAEFSPLKGRGARHNLIRNNKKFLLIDDSYNANPASMKAALRVLGDVDRSGRKLAIISNMVELGPNSADLHRDLSHDIENNNIDKVIAIGENMKFLYDAIPEHKRLARFDQVSELMPVIDDYINNNDIILVKGSNGTGIFKLVDNLVK